MSTPETTLHCKSSEIANPLDDDSWDDRILVHAKATIFHTSAWARVLNGAFGYKPFYFCTTKGDQLATCLPVMEIDSWLFGRRGKTLPFTDYCELLDTEKAESRQLLDEVLDFGRSRKWKSYEMRGGTDVSESVVAHRTCYSHTVRLEQDVDQVFARFRGSTRRNIRRAINCGVQVQYHDSLESIKAYYRLHCITRKRQGHFTQPFVLFRKIHEEIISKGNGFLSLALFNGRPIAGAIFFHANGHAFYGYGASDKSFQHLRPNNLLIWRAIQRYTELDCHELDLGITDDGNNGLRRYKNGMATTERTVHYYKYDFRQSEFINHNTSLLNDLRIATGKKLPTAVLNAAGTLLYKHHG